MLELSAACMDKASHSTLETCKAADSEISVGCDVKFLLDGVVLAN
jgi:hypothetical protein